MQINCVKIIPLRINYNIEVMELFTVETFSSDETESVGRQLFKKVKYPSFIALYGDLGAGKTAFVRGMVSAFDSEAIVTSPTYNIVNKYTFGDKSLYHFDMYRVTDEDDLYSVGFYDYLDNGIIVTEWSENIPYALPETYYKVTISKDNLDTNKRIIKAELVE